jgi:hypothetical protein
MAGGVEGKLASQSGLAALAPQRDEMRKQYADMQKDRAFDTFLATMAGGAQGRGGYAKAYLGAKGGYQDADLGQSGRAYGLDAGAADVRYKSQNDLFNKGTTEVGKERDDRREAAKALLGKRDTANSTETERLMAHVSDLRRQGKSAEAEAYLRAWKEAKSAASDGDQGKFRSTAIQELQKSYTELSKNPITKPKVTLQEYIDTNLQQMLSVLGGASAAPAGATRPPAGGGSTGTMSPSAFRSQYDALKQQLNR